MRDDRAVDAAMYPDDQRAFVVSGSAQRAGERIDVAFVACANGLGHLRRIINVGNTISALRADLRMGLLVDFAVEIPFELGPQWTVERSSLPVRWRSEESFVPGDLVGWEMALEGNRVLMQARVVVSDNLASVLAVRPDAVLQGSFLWSDVLSVAFGENDEVQRFVERERALLDQHRPPMINVKDAVMPGVGARVESIGVGWMPRPEECFVLDENANDARIEVAVFSGATGMADPALLDAGRSVLAAGGNLAAPNHIAEKLRAETGHAVRCLDFSPDERRRMGAAILRPGMGSIQECLGAGIPMVVVGAAGNAELQHLAHVIETRGFGIVAVDGEGAAAAALSYLGSGGHGARAAMKTLDFGGLAGAAQYLINRLGDEARSLSSGTTATGVQG